MNDRELLELAAKAVGMRWSYDLNKEVWNPLRSDGDALRLAVKLQMCIDIVGNRVMAVSPVEGSSVEIYCKDQFAATRNAIVQCAAKIGKEL